MLELAKQRARIAHALLVHGREGAGQIEFALALSRQLLCESPTEQGLACSRCAACNWFALGNHPDFRLIQPESLEPDAENEAQSARKEKKSTQIRIEQVRALQDFLAVGTHRAGYRVIVLHPAEAMNAPTQNALLKSLEEPPPATVFLLATSRPHRLLATVRSRCQRIAVPFPDRSQALRWLEGQGVPEADALLALSGGAPLVAARLAEADPLRRRLIAQLRDPRFDVVAATEHCLRVEPAEAVAWLQRWVYDLLSSRLCGKIRYHLEDSATIPRLAAALEPAAVAGVLRALAGARALSQHPLNARLFFEDLLFKYRALWGSP
ncbi:MAG: DNA polymerase III subunit delta' [Betaproteobacteria bacterium]|nr:DNA polymerase III subunit delta' [Betaproteobacteria bacterium]